MTERTDRPPFPGALNCEQLRDYFEWHVQNGRGSYFPEIRSHYFAMLPTNETHDDALRVVFVEGCY